MEKKGARGLGGGGLEPQSTDQGSQGPSDGPDFKLRVYCSRPPSGRPRSTVGLPVLRAGWQFSEAWGRVQARRGHWDGVLPPGHRTQRRSGVAGRVNALSQARLGCEPSLLQLLVEPVVCGGSCKRKQGLGEEDPSRQEWVVGTLEVSPGRR